MSDRREGAAETQPDRAVLLRDIAWERIQLHLRLGDQPGVAPDRLVLAASWPDADTATMPPTHVDQDANGMLLRFNVMLGPGQHPLRSGQWVLSVLSDHGEPEPLPLRLATPLDADRLYREFKYPGGRYQVTPALDETGILAVTVRNRRGGRGRLPARRWTLTYWKRWFRRRAWFRRRVFLTLYRLHRLMAPRDGRRILFTSDSQSRLSGNLAVIHDRMVARGLNRDYRLQTLFRPSIAMRRGWRDRWRLPRLLARADVILLDDFQPVIYRLPPDPRQRIIQVWHASGALKTVGYSRVGKPGGPTPFARRHKNYTHALVSGAHDVPYYAEAFGLPEERVVPTGIPRMDRYFDPAHRDASIARARELFPQIDGRFTILFAPTFRGHGPRGAHYHYDQIDWAALHAMCEEKNAVVIWKMHPFVRVPAPIPDAYRDRIIDASRAPIDVNDLIFAVDLLVTDYSSIVFEFSTQMKPMIFFAYDLDEYIASRDFYVPFEEFVPGPIVRTFDDLLQLVRSHRYDATEVAAFARRHFDHLDGSATDRVIDELILAQPS
jgi:CDP-ribitol ribitolphosphotransferase / teichoic acid ribitol-phosphate polymerase